MKFNKDSDVTLVITSCGRFELLKQTIESFDKYNTYPIKEAIIIEDSSDNEIDKIIPLHWQEHTTAIVNKPKLGQIKSIDLAYERVKTNYIFHCEDDWLFYRNNFIEESKFILENNKDILQVWLRDYNEDIKINYPFHYPAEKYILNNIVFYKLGSNNKDWLDFSLNPGLKRKSDYDAIKPYFCNRTADKTKSYLSSLYYEKDMFAVFLKKSAVKHIGWKHHILSNSEIKDKKRKNIKKIKYITIGFLTCYFIYS